MQWKKFSRMYNKNPVSDQDKAQVKNLVEEGKKRVSELMKIDKEIMAIQTSTKTTFSFFIPVHNYLRMRYKWYYNWHTKPYATKVNVAVLCVVVLFCIGIGASSLVISPKTSFAAGNSCVSQVTTGNWSAAATWSGCGGLAPQVGDSATITAGQTITVDTVQSVGSSGSVTVNGNLTLSAALTVGNTTISSGGVITTNGNAITIGGSYSNAGTFTNNSGTVTFNATTTGKTLAGTMTGTSAFYNLIFNGVGGGWTLSNDAVVSNNLTITNGSVTAPSSLTIGGSYSNAGTFTNNSGTVTFNATTTGKTLAGTMTGTSAFYNLTVNGTGGGWTLSNNTNIGNDLSVSLGTLALSSMTVNVTHDVIIANSASATLSATTANVTVGHDWNKGTSGLTGMQNGSTVNLTGDGTITAGASTQFGNLNLGYSNKTTTVSVSRFDIFGVITFKGGTVNTTVTNTIEMLIGSGTHLAFESPTALTGNTTIHYRPSITNTISITGGNYGSWTVATDTSAGNGTAYQLTGNVITTGDMYISARTGVTGTTFNTMNFNITARSFRLGWLSVGFCNSIAASFGSSTVVLSNGTSDALYVDNNCGAQTLDMGSSNVTVTGNVKLIYGTGTLAITPGTSTLTMAPAASSTTAYIPNGQHLYNLIINGNATGSVQPSAAVLVDNDLTMTAGSLIGTQNISVNGNVVGTNGVINLTGGVFSQYNYSSLTKNLGTTSGSAAWTFYDLKFLATATSTYTINTSSGGTGAINITNTMVLGNTTGIAPPASSVTVNAGDRRWVLSGTTGVPLIIGSRGSPILNAQTSTFVYTGNYVSGSTTLGMSSGAASAFYNVEINNASETFNLPMNTTISNNLTITSGVMSTTASNYDLLIGGNYSNSGTFTANSGTVVLGGTATQGLSGNMTGSNAFNNLTITNASGTSASDNERANFVPGVDFNSAATVSGTYTAVTPNTRVEYQSGAAYTFTNINWNGQASGTRIYFRNSATTGTWLLNVSGTQTAVSYVNVSRSNATGGSQISSHNGTDVDAQNNTNWLFDNPANNPTSLDQKKVTGGSSIPVGGWTNETQVQFTALTTDPDSSDTEYLCVEKKAIGVAFADTEDLCGSGVAYSGSAVAVNVTITGQAAATQYRWQARVKDAAGYYSGWVSFGGNSDPSDADYGIDTAAPTNDIYLSPSSPNGDNSYYKTVAPTITFSANDNSGSGASTIYYAWDLSNPSDNNTADFTAYSGSALTAAEGIHTIYYIGTDAAGNKTSTISRQIKVDTITPTVAVAASPSAPNGSNNYYIGVAPTITLNGSDAGSGLVSVQYKWDSASYSTYSIPLTVSEGVHTLSFYGVDNAGNNGASNAYSVTYSVETVSQVVTLTTSPVAPNGSNGYYIASVPSITLAATNSNSGISAIKYHWGSDTDQTYSASFTPAEGVNTLTYYAVTNAGNSSPTYTQTFKVDLTNPATDIYVSPGSPDGNNNYYIHSPSVTFSISDSGSGNDGIYYRWGNSGQFSLYGTALNASEGDDTIYYYGKDNAGNQTATFSREIKLDTSNPTSSATATPTTPNGSNGYYISAVPTVTLSSGDAGSGVSSIQYKWDSDSYTTYTTALTASEGTHTLTYYSVDAAGNNSSTGTETFKVDLGLPTASVTSDPAIPNGTNGWYKGSAPVISLGLTDSNSGPEVIYFKWDSNTPVSYFSSMTAPSGDHILSYYGIDNAGNRSSTATQEYKVDTTSPTASIQSVTPASPNGSNDYYKGVQPVIALTGNDGGSGLAAIKYRFGESNDWLTYDSGNKPLVPEGVTTIYFYGVDNAGNDSSGSMGNQTFKVDLSGPVMSSTAPATTSPTNKLGVTFVWPEASDAGSSVSYYQVSVGITSGESDIESNKIVSSPAFSETFSKPGTYYIRVRAVDVNGLVGGYSSEGSVLIDQTTPTITINNLVDNTFVTSKNITFSGASSAAISGIAKVQLQIDNGSWQDAKSTNGFTDWSYDWSGYEEGNHTLVARAINNAGTDASTTTFHVVVDTVAPSVPGDLRVFNASNPTDGVLVVYLDYAASTDATSGIKQYSVYKDGTKIVDISPDQIATNLNYTGNTNQPYFYVDDGVSSGTHKYSISATDNAGNVAQTADVATDTAAKAITNESVTNMQGIPSSVVTKDTTAGIIKWDTVYPATSQVEYGETTTYGQKTDIDNDFNQGHTVLLSGLKPGSLYHFRATSTDIYGKTIVSEDNTFTTNTPPEQQSALKVIINTLQNLFNILRVHGASNVASSSVDVSALQDYSNSLLVTDISYKEKSLYQNIMTFPKGSNIQRGTNGGGYQTLGASSDYYIDHNLAVDTSYNYRNGSGLPIVRKPVVGDTSPLTITDPQVVKESVFVSSDKVQLTLSWKTNRGATSQAQFGQASTYGQTTKNDTAFDVGHDIILDGLNPDTVYHFQVTSTDSKGAVARSNDFTFQTPTAQKERTVLDIIFESFQRILGAFNNLF